MITLFLILWPVVVSLTIFIFRPKISKQIALLASLVEFILSLVVIFQFDGSGAAAFSMNIPWIASLGINFHIAIDGISLLLVLLTTGLMPFIILSSFNGPRQNSPNFYALILMMQMALIGVFTALDGFLFYVFWEMALIPIYFICLIWGGENKSRITLKFFIYTLAGSLLMLVALLILYYKTPGQHSFDIQALYAAGRSLGAAEQGLVFWGLFLAFAIKMPIFPFHTWQPDTYTVAPVEGTMLLSGIMLKMGFYGVIRWLIPMVPLGVTDWGFVAVLLSVVGIVYASALAIYQQDFKRLIAYASIAHVGLMSAGLLTLNKIGMQGALIQMISHGILAFALFYICEIISVRTNTRVIASLGGLRTNAPILTTVLMIAILGTVALPLTSGFVGEFLLLNSLFQYNFIIGATGGLTIILGAVYCLRAFQYMMLGKNTTTTTSISDLTGNEKIVLYPIVILIFVIGIHPDPLLKISEAAVGDLLELYVNFSAKTK
ncbi:NADH-quinone oxidoreductase subunit M [Chryseolinea sp. H1M3-3]|uniref:complex I subunit 4 family protein n=1 Tax=Chryseolinea sp. H1M3-3 TaxID=3034144 RepID=UPI0023EB21B9|nr:NADH-quinone oxidoreductase subunit M [Chryseolinea sp. H1M3-3]